MIIAAKTFDDYIAKCPKDRQEAISRLRNIIAENIPDGFEEAVSYGAPGWVVPHSIYPAGYHCKPSEPLPFAGIASQKNFIAFYHMGIYAMPEILEWFVKEYPKYSKTKLDMGKSCIRWKKPEHIPFELIGKLARKITVDDWVNVYETNLKR
jgi:uncharacterized protein YdhG (YjbR/CyaY superfamily)